MITIVIIITGNYTTIIAHDILWIRNSSGHSLVTVRKRFTIQTLVWSLEVVMHNISRERHNWSSKLGWRLNYHNLNDNLLRTTTNMFLLSPKSNIFLILLQNFLKLPCRHSMSFQCRYDVTRCHTTLYGV